MELRRFSRNFAKNQVSRFYSSPGVLTAVRLRRFCDPVENASGKIQFHGKEGKSLFSGSRAG